MIRWGALAGVAAAAVLAVWPGGAVAKGVPSSVELCGPSACVTVTDRAVRIRIAHALERGAGTAARLGPYLRLTARPAMFDLRGYLIPGPGIVQVNGISHRLGPRAAGVIRARVAALVPYRPRITAVWLGSRAVPHPGAFAALLRRPPVAMPAAVWDHRGVLIAIGLAGRTPWDGWGSALYFPRLRLLHVPDGAWVRVTAAQAAMIAADRRSRSPGGGSGGAASIAIGAGIAATGLAAAVTARRRRRPWRRPRAI